MRSKVKHIIKIMLIFALIMCWSISIGYANAIKTENKVVNFYFEDSNVGVSSVTEISKIREDISVVGWAESQLQTVVNPDLSRSVNNLKILFVKGRTSLLIESSLLFEDDKEGCLIDEDTAYKLFGSNHVVGKQISYGNRNLTIRGIHKETNANVIMQFVDGNEEQLDGITIDTTNLNRSEIDEIKMQAGLKEQPISGGIYYNIANLMVLIMPFIMIILLLKDIIVDAIKIRKRPVLLSIYFVVAIITLILFIKITKINFNIPLDLIPNKWSDFDFWGRLWKEYVDKFEYVLYMKKYGIEIYNIQNMIMASLFSILTVILFRFNLKYIKIKNLKELIIALAVIITITFFVVLLVYYKYKFDVNVTMLWGMYPLFLCGRYFIREIKRLKT